RGPRARGRPQAAGAACGGRTWVGRRGRRPLYRCRRRRTRRLHRSARYPCRGQDAFLRAVMTYRISRAAEADIVDILAWSHDQFGEQARHRYEKLIAAAIRDIARDPTRSGSAERPELGNGVRSWPLRASRYHTAGDVVRRPRHSLIYRIA